MLSKRRLILQHKKTGLYFSGSELEPTKDLWKARRFFDMEYLVMYLEVANFAPRDPSEYDVIEIELTITEVEQ